MAINFGRVLAATVVACVLGTAASAATITNNFNFTTPSITNKPDWTFYGDNGLSVFVDGYNYTKSGGTLVKGNPIDVENNSYGLISCNSYEAGWRGNCGSPDHAIDSYGGKNEAMILDFGKAVTLTNLDFGWASGAKTYDLFVLVSGAFNLLGTYSVYDTLLPVVGQVFAIGASSTTTVTYVQSCGWQRINGKWCNVCTQVPKTKTIDTAFKLKGATVTYDEPPAVPLPAAGVLLIGALGGLGLLRKRKA